MSISIGRIPVYNTTDVPLRIYTGSSNLIKLRSDLQTSAVYLNDSFQFGQNTQNAQDTFKVKYNNIALSQYSSNQIRYEIDTLFQSNVRMEQNLIVQSNLFTQTISSSNVSIYGNMNKPFCIVNGNEPLFEINQNGLCYIPGNLGIGQSPNYNLDVASTSFIHSNLRIGNIIQMNRIVSSNIHSTSNLANYIDLNASFILIDAPTVIINNPILTGTITYTGTIVLNQSLIANIETSNIRILNNQLNQQGMYIKNLNPGTFANTANGSPLHIESYFASGNTIEPIFEVDTFGRIASGKLITTDTSPDYGFSYQLTSCNDPYLRNFIEWTTERPIEQTIISKKGWMHIGSNTTPLHLMQITNQYTGYEDNYEPKLSLIGTYQQSSNIVPILIAYDCNQNVKFKITSNGTLLFHPHQQYDTSYSLEVLQKAYIHTVNVEQLFTQQSNIDFSEQQMSNISSIYLQRLNVQQGGTLSNIYVNGLTTPNITINAFEYIDKPSTQYREFRIATDRLLFYGSNFVINPSHAFFEFEQTRLPDDNIRIYGNGGPTETVSVIHTIASNQISTIKMNNCNVAENTAARIQVEANNKLFSLGTIYKSTGTEAFITNNTDLVSTNRPLSITETNIRVGTSIYLSKTGTTTFGDTTQGINCLNVKGDMNIQTSTNNPGFFISSTGNVGISTNIPRRNVDFQVPTVYLVGNLGIGTTQVQYPLDVNGTIRANRVKGVQYSDIVNATENTTQWIISGCNIYYTTGNVGIGSYVPNALLSINGGATQKSIIQMAYSNVSSVTKVFNYSINPSKLSILGGLAVGHSNQVMDVVVPQDSMIIDGSIGIGTTQFSKTLRVQGDTKISYHTSNQGRIYIGSNLNGNVGGQIFLTGTFGDNNYDHTVIENRVYSTATEKSELLLFKGNDYNDGSSGPDRIRLRASEINFDVYKSSTSDRYSSNIIVRVTPSDTTVNGTTSLSSTTYVSTLQSMNGTRMLQYNQYNTAGTYTISQPANYSYVRIQMWGAGGGGGGANIQETASYAVGTQLGGGGGGGGGAYGDVIIPYDIAGSSTLSATIGAGGAGGISGYIYSSTQITTTTTSSGANGQAATSGTAGTSTSLTLTTIGASSLTATWTVGGGGGGAVGIGSAAGAAGTGGTISITTYFNSTKPGTAGGAGGTTGVGGDGTNLTGGVATFASAVHPGTANTGLGASGGGGGAGSPASRPATVAYYSGGNSGAGCIPYSFLTGTAIFAYGQKREINGTIIKIGESGYSYSSTYGGGTGGGGGFSKNGNLGAGFYYGFGYYGSIGGWPGGGGGGGGAGRTIHPNATDYSIELTGGAGGNGADGGMIVTFY